MIGKIAVAVWQYDTIEEHFGVVVWLEGVKVIPKIGF